MGKYDEKDGVWRTIRGRRIFIASGESLGQAMAKSGKFKREDIREGKRELSRGIAARKAFGDETNKKQSRKAINKLIKTDSTGHYRSGIQAEKNRINEDGRIVEGAKTRVGRNWNKYSKEQQREIPHENIQKKLAEYKAKKQSNNKLNNEYTRQELKDKYGTDDVELINAGKEKENRVKLIDEKRSNNIFQPTKEDLKEMQTYDRANDIRPELSNNKVNDNEIVNDDSQAISYSFRTNKRDMFTIRYNRVGSNKNMDFATTASTFNRNRTDYERGGQAQKDVLKEGTKARAFYDKWDKKHLGTLTQKEYKELVNDIEDLKKEYPYIQGDRFYDQVELDRNTKDKKSKIEAYKKRKGK